ncbi:MAG: hypothetical protein IJI22_01775 [Bacilli bacterium]|nr:hypothetical protein [Bacilli bacterium]
MKKYNEDEYYEEYVELDEDELDDDEEYEDYDDYDEEKKYEKLITSYRERKKRKNKNKNIRIFSLKNIFISLIIVAIILFIITLVDINRIKHNKMPIITIKTVAYKDGGTKEYYGIGYKVIKYHQIQGRRDTELGRWKLKYNTDAITVKDVDLAIEMRGNELRTYSKYNKKFVRVISTLKEKDPEDNKLVMGFTDEDGKYSLNIVCKMVDDYKTLENFELDKETTIIGTVDNFKRKNNTQPTTIYIKNCFAEQ